MNDSSAKVVTETITTEDELMEEVLGCMATDPQNEKELEAAQAGLKEKRKRVMRQFMAASKAAGKKVHEAKGAAKAKAATGPGPAPGPGPPPIAPCARSAD